MFIDALIDFYERNGERMDPPCHRSKDVSWLLELDKRGTFRGLTDVSEQGIEVIAPASMRAGRKVLAHLVVDNAGYVLGYHGTASTAKKRCGQYRSKVATAAEHIGSESLHALDAFLNSAHQTRKALVAARDHKVEYRGENILPVVNDTFLACKAGQRPSELHQALHREWHRMFREEYEARPAQCLLCEKEKPALDRHEKVSLFGLYTSFVNMNKEAFMSHGLTNSTNAPMCAGCEPKYVQPLRYFTDSERHQLLTRYDTDKGSASGWLAWLREDTSDFDFAFLKKPRSEDALDALKSIWRSRSRDLDANQFYAVSVTASDHRFSIRNFQTLGLGKAIEKTEEYFERQKLLRCGEEQTYSLFSLLEAAAPLVKDQNTGRREPDREKLPPRFADALVEHILTGHALPNVLRDRALRRCRAELATEAEGSEDRRRIDFAVPVHRAALLKLFLCSQDEEIMPEERKPTEKLDREHPDPAYHCGRYLAVADAVYYSASDGSSENYVSKRYYTSLSTTPASTVGRIISNVQHQLDKLRRTRGGRATNLDQKITQIMGRIGNFPKTLRPNEQALFALGFYHQRDHIMTPSDDNGNSDSENDESENESA